ncbi:MAG: phage terminase large subunit [Candidatus Pacearchaeota archaeon]|nr:phage terminase large subunit [Candidatus Pacearchaeota archaeon]
MKEKINFFKLSNFFVKQKIALEATKQYKYVLYAGSAGSGKSHWLRWTSIYWLLYWAGKGIKNVQVVIFCETYPALHDRHLKKIKSDMPSWLGDFYEQKKEFVLKKEYGGGIIAFRNLDEPDKYQSSEFALIAVDELTKNPKTTFDLLRSRLRWVGVDETKFIAATNPFGEHMNWVRSLWIERKFPPELESERNKFIVIEAKSYDNPYLPQEYFKSLETLPEKERKAFLEGDWYAFDEEVDEKGFIPLITAKDIENSLIDEHPNMFILKPVIMGVDIGAGRDKSVIVIRNNYYAKVLFAQRLDDTMALISHIVNFFNIYQPERIIIDTTGIGRGLYDRMRETGWSTLIKSCQFGERATLPDFKNKKAELFWKLKNWIKTGKLVNSEYWNELLDIKYKIQSDKMIYIMSKEEMRAEGINSPDVADALALTFDENIENLSAMSELDFLGFNSYI